MGATFLITGASFLITGPTSFNTVTTFVITGAFVFTHDANDAPHNTGATFFITKTIFSLPWEHISQHFSNFLDTRSNFLYCGVIFSLLDHLPYYGSNLLYYRSKSLLGETSCWEQRSVLWEPVSLLREQVSSQQQLPFFLDEFSSVLEPFFKHRYSQLPE